MQKIFVDIDPNSSWSRKISNKFYSDKMKNSQVALKFIYKVKNSKAFPTIAKTLLKIGEKHEIDLLKSIIKKEMIVLDIGANIGVHTEVISKAVGEKGKVYAFEPEPNNYKLLTEMITKKHLSNVTTYNLALSNKSGDTTLFIDDVNTGNHSFAKDNIFICTKSHKVKTEQLDNFEDIVKHVDVIKIDVQGAEGLVFEGAKELLNKNTKLVILMEFWPAGMRKVGTDPLAFLKDFVSNNFTIKLLSKRKFSKVLSFDELEEIVNTWRDDKEYANLLLERN